MTDSPLHRHPQDISSLTLDSGSVEVAGQVLGTRTSKKIIFIDLGLPEEENVQIAVNTSEEQPYTAPAIGSLLYVRGETGETALSKRRGLGQLTIFTQPGDCALLSRPLRPRWFGANVPEQHQLQSEYLTALRARDEMHFNLRVLLRELGYTHVDTSILQQQASGAAARTFETDVNFDSSHRHLRIAPEIDLKLVMAKSGLNKVFEIARNFRNEGISSDHHPEFTAMEAYTAFMTQEEAIDLCLAVLNTISQSVGSDYVFDSKTIRREQYGALLDEHLFDFNFSHLTALTPDGREAYMKEYLRENNILQEELRDKDYIGALDWLFKKSVRPKLQEPVIVTGYLAQQMPLAASDPINPRLVEGFQVIVEGAEIVKAYSEEVSPNNVRQNLTNQLSTDTEDTVRFDMRLVEACEMGLAPMYGIGWGLDRIHKIFARHKDISHVIPVPLTAR